MNWYERDKERREFFAGLRIAGQVGLLLVLVAVIVFLAH